MKTQSVLKYIFLNMNYYLLIRLTSHIGFMTLKKKANIGLFSVRLKDLCGACVLDMYLAANRAKKFLWIKNDIVHVGAEMDVEENFFFFLLFRCHAAQSHCSSCSPAIMLEKLTKTSGVCAERIFFLPRMCVSLARSLWCHSSFFTFLFLSWGGRRSTLRTH